VLPLRCLAIAPIGLLALACGHSGAPSRGGSALPPSTSATMTCPAPVGVVPKEDCADIADDFGALSVEGALPLAGAGRYAEQRLAAIRAVGALAQSIKEQRVRLCEAYVHCTVPVAERDAQDQVLSGAMRSLIDLWNRRRLASLDEVTRFREAVRAVEQRVSPGVESSSGQEGGRVYSPVPPRRFNAGEVLERMSDPAIAFRAEAGSVMVSTTTEGKHDALLSKPDALVLPAGHRYRLEVTGAYRPAVPSLVQPGDELLARLAYRAAGAATLQLALRSLEDPEAVESTDTFTVANGETGAHEAKLTADPQQTGFYLGVTVKGAPVELDEIELLRAGRVIATGRLGAPGTRSECTPGAGRALHCPPGEGDRVTLGQPEGYLILDLRDATGPRASTRALSLEGGRSVDALVGEGAQLVVTLVGSGSVTLERIQVSDLGL